VLFRSRTDQQARLCRDPNSAGNPHAGADAKEEHFSVSEVIPAPSPARTSFFSDKIDFDDPRRQEQFRRLWYLQNNLHIRPTNPRLGPDARYYADEYAKTANSSSYDRCTQERAEAICDKLGLPHPVRKTVYRIIHDVDLRGYSQEEGLDCGVLVFAASGLLDYCQYDSMDDLKATPWWESIKTLADELGVRGATGRRFRMALERAHDDYPSFTGGEQGGD
jgi:hypothetical protein